MYQGYSYDNYKQDNSQYLECIQSHGSQDPKQLKSNKSKKDPTEEVTLLSQAACSVILCN